MEQQDYLKRQIDQLARILGKVLTLLPGLNKNGQLTYAYEASEQIIKTELDIDIRRLINMPSDELINYLKSEKYYTNQNLGKLADILFLTAQYATDNDKQSLYLKSLSVFEYLETAEKTYAIDRQLKIKQIRELL